MTAAKALQNVFSLSAISVLNGDMTDALFERARRVGRRKWRVAPAAHQLQCLQSLYLLCACIHEVVGVYKQVYCRSFDVCVTTHRWNDQCFFLVLLSPFSRKICHHEKELPHETRTMTKPQTDKIRIETSPSVSLPLSTTTTTTAPIVLSSSFSSSLS